ncbi:IclR family transcriptional regulator domain-containing protein [Modicisalibacter muralis]|uniref:IclR family transcriptional regulator domain-containing protein n=1 Tax=Modicisalibacter muralis TaxID=119000 RepID=UPI00351D5302
MRSLAVPTFDANGKLLGAINVSTNAARIDLATLTDKFLPLLQEETRQIATQVS